MKNSSRIVCASIIGAVATIPQLTAPSASAVTRHAAVPVRPAAVGQAVWVNTPTVKNRRDHVQFRFDSPVITKAQAGTVMQVNVSRGVGDRIDCSTVQVGYPHGATWHTITSVTSHTCTEDSVIFRFKVPAAAVGWKVETFGDATTTDNTTKHLPVYGAFHIDGHPYLAMATAIRPAAVNRSATTPASDDPTPVAGNPAAADEMTVPVYQRDNPAGPSLQDPTKGTVDAAAAQLTTTQGAPFFASTTQRDGLTGVHRLYNAATGDYLYVPDTSSELATDLANGYTDQGIVYYVSLVAEPNTAPMYRLQKGGKHLYTTSAATVATLTKSGWTSDGTQFQVDTKPVAAFDAAYHDNNTYAYVNSQNTANSDSDRLNDWQVAREAHTTWAMGTASSDTAVQKVLTNAAAANQVAQLTLYAIPGRDCGSFSAGGLADDATYKAWINKLSGWVGAQRAMIVVEPDAIGYCGNTKTDEYNTLLNYVGATFKANNPAAELYLHAGSGQFKTGDMLTRFQNIGIQNYRGFAMDVSGLGGTSQQEQWAESMVSYAAAKGVPNLHYIVDSSRSGINNPANVAGAAYGSCNNTNAAVGPRPSAKNPSSAPAEDAYLWVKSIGLSDGECGKGDPPAGTFHQGYVNAVVANGVTAGTITMIPQGQ